MINYQKASDVKLKTVITEFKEYAYENVIVAVCELRSREGDIPQYVIDDFCEKYRIANIDKGIVDFLQSHKVKSYTDYCRKVEAEGTTSTSQPAPHQSRVREWEQSGSNYAATRSSNVDAAQRSLKYASLFTILLFIIFLVLGSYWYMRIVEVALDRVFLADLLPAMNFQFWVVIINFVLIFYHLGRARVKMNA